MKELNIGTTGISIQTGYETLFTIWFHLSNFKNVKDAPGGVIPKSFSS